MRHNRAITPELFFPTTGRCHGAIGNVGVGYKVHGVPPKQRLSCLHEECRSGFGKSHNVGSVENHNLHLSQRTFGNPPERKAKRNLVMTQCISCKGEGRVFSFHKGTYVLCPLACEVSKDNRGLMI